MRGVRVARDTAPPETISMPCPHCGHRMRGVNGAFLRHRREAAGVDQRTFGTRVNASGPYVSDIERNRRACPPDILAAYRRLKPRRRRA